MADISRSPAPPALPSEPELLALAELLFFAYRDFTADADAVLADYGFGRAHHRVLHFVDRYPQLRVADLLDMLAITKQSLARVLRDLVTQGFVTQQAGAHDRRERRLSTTPSGARLARRLFDAQAAKLADAVQPAGEDVQAEVRAFLFAMISAKDRDVIMARLATRPGALQGD